MTQDYRNSIEEEAKDFFITLNGITANVCFLDSHIVIDNDDEKVEDFDILEISYPEFEKTLYKNDGKFEV